MSKKPSIHVETRYISPAGQSLPALVLQATILVDSYMLWVGVTEESEENMDIALLQGSLARDWACAMPPVKAQPVIGTPLFRSSSSDIALAMTQRLARRFKKQIFLSVDVPPTFTSMGQGSHVLLGIEKALVATIQQLEKAKDPENVRYAP